MYRNITDFLKDWKHESESTAKVFSMITEETRQTKLNENVRSLDRLAWHITQSLTELGHRGGLFQADALEQAPLPENITSLVNIYNDYAEQFAKAVISKWTNPALRDKIYMYGRPWAKGTILRVLITHQTHHRGQMTVIMRMLGLPVPGIYGRSKEEWAEIGMRAPE